MNLRSLSLLSLLAFSFSLFLSVSLSSKRQKAPLRQLSEGQFSHRSPKNPGWQTHDAWPEADWMHVPPLRQRSSHTLARVSHRSPVHSAVQLHFKGGVSEATNKSINISINSIQFNSFVLRNLHSLTAELNQPFIRTFSKNLYDCSSI